MRTQIRRWLLVPVLLALGSAVTVAGQAQATAPPENVPLEVDQAFDEEGQRPVNCLGGPQKRSLARMNDLPQTLAEGAAGGFTELPGSRVAFGTNDTDQIMVTFSAEGQLQGQSGGIVAPVDFLQVRIVLDGTPMPPHNDLMFTTDAGGAHAIEACQRVPEGQHELWVEWLLVDQGLDEVLTGTLDDSTVHIEVND